MRRGWLAGAIVVAGLIPAGLLAARSQTLAISPAYQQAEVSGDHPITSFQIELSNFTAVDERFSLTTTDFTASGEDGGVAFLGQSSQTINNPRRLAEWMSLSADTVLVPAGQSAPVEVTITNREGMAPGGHYGAVLATAEDATAPGNGQPQVGLKQALSTLVLVTKDGGGQPDLQLESQAGGGWWHLPSTLVHRFENLGNVHVTPRGVVTVTDPLGRMVERGALNDGSGIILPSSFRRYTTSLLGVGSAWLPGRYTVTTSYRYDGIQTTKTLVTHIWYAGQVGVWLSLLVGMMALGYGLWWAWRWWRHRCRKRR
jgi:hypothetical protein